MTEQPQPDTQPTLSSLSGLTPATLRETRAMLARARANDPAPAPVEIPDRRSTVEHGKVAPAIIT